jgi:hypothetical protein
LYELVSEAPQFGKWALTFEYKKLCELFAGSRYLQVFIFISLAPAMKQLFFRQIFFNVADKKVHWQNILFLIHG